MDGNTPVAGNGGPPKRRRKTPTRQRRKGTKVLPPFPLTEEQLKHVAEGFERGLLVWYLTKFVADLSKTPLMPLEEVERRVGVISTGIKDYKRRLGLLPKPRKRGRPKSSGKTHHSQA